MAKKRRGNGEGAIYQRANGKWCATYSTGYNEEGKRRRRTVYGATREEVRNKLTKLMSSKLDGMLVEVNKLTVGGFLDRWLEDSSRPSVRITTYVSYKGVIKNHIKPRIGGLMLANLTPVHVQGLYGEMERAGASRRLRQLTHAVLRRALKIAVRWSLVPRNVCDAVDPPRVMKFEVCPLTEEQVVQLLATARNERLYAIYVTAIGTGMRLGELFGLQWRDVDLRRGRLTICRALIEVNGKILLEEPKTVRSRRCVTLPQIAIDALAEHRQKMADAGFDQTDWVFCNVRGGPLRRSHFHNYCFKPLLKRAKLPDIRFHDLRHTSATMLLSAGVHPKVVQERLGHSQISITLDTYSHVLPTMQREAAVKLDKMMR